MTNLIKAVVPLFARPNNYAEMLQKLAGFTFWEATILIYILRQNPKFDRLLEDSFLNLLPSEALPEELRWIHAPTIIISLFIAFSFYYFQIHDQIQKPFKIRERFDTNHIFVPLARLIGINPSESKILNFKLNRNTTMRQIFYRFASSTKDNTVVDKHDIHQALWRWSNFWALEELIFLLLVFSFIFIYFEMWLPAVAVIAICAIAAFTMRQQWPRLSSTARAQIEQIADDADAKASVRKVINAL